MVAISPPQQPIENDLVTLRLSDERDIPEILIAYQDDRHLHHRLGQPRPPSAADLGRACEQAADDLAAGLRVRMAICPAGRDTCVGQVAIGQLDWENLRGELVVWVAPGARGRGYATAAIGLAARWVFTEYRLGRLMLAVEPDNEPMLRAAAAVGAQREGIVRSYRKTRRKRLDMAMLSLLPADLRR